MWKLSRRRWSTNQIILIVLLIIICNILFLTYYPMPNQLQQDDQDNFPWVNKEIPPWQNKRTKEDHRLKRDEGYRSDESDEMEMREQKKTQHQMQLRNHKIQKPHNEGIIVFSPRLPSGNWRRVRSLKTLTNISLKGKFLSIVL